MIQRDGSQGGKWIGKGRPDCQTFQFRQLLRGKPGIACARYECLCRTSERSSQHIKGGHTGLLSKKPKFGTG